jgi:hypothetical protein
LSQIGTYFCLVAVEKIEKYRLAFSSSGRFNVHSPEEAGNG